MLPVARATTASAPVQSVSNDRRRIFDARDLRAMVEDVRRTGTPDERDWAVHMLQACAAILGRPAATGVSLKPTQDESVTPEAPTEKLATQMKQARDLLGARCSGFKGMSPDDRKNLKDALLLPAIGLSTPLRDLADLATVEDGRWSEPQAQLITRSLYSGDAALSSSAFQALLASVDRNAPGGMDRLRALMWSVGPAMSSGPQSDYERLAACANSARCDAYELADDPGDLNSSTRELIEKYKAAIAEHADARTLATLR